MLLQLVWDAILYNVAWGCLIGGGIITVVSMVLAGIQLEHAMDSDAGGVDHDVSDADNDVAADNDLSADNDVAADNNLSADNDVATDSDLSADSDVAADSDLSADSDVAADSDLSADHDLSVDHDSPLVTSQTGAPLLLLLSAWFLWFGVLGVTTYYSLTQKAVWVGIIMVVPVGLSYLMAQAWKKIAKSQMYKVPVGYERIGEVAEVYRPVSDEGGMVRVKSDSPLGYEVLPVKPLQTLEKFATGQKVYLCDLQKGIYLVSTHSKFIRRYRPRAQ